MGHLSLLNCINTILDLVCIVSWWLLLGFIGPMPDADVVLLLTTSQPTCTGFECWINVIHLAGNFMHFDHEVIIAHWPPSSTLYQQKVQYLIAHRFSTTKPFFVLQNFFGAAATSLPSPNTLSHIFCQLESVLPFSFCCYHLLCMVPVQHPKFELNSEANELWTAIENKMTF